MLRPPDLSRRPFSLSIERVIALPPEKLYRAWTEQIDHWFAAPGSVLMRAEVDAPFFFERPPARDPGRRRAPSALRALPAARASAARRAHVGDRCRGNEGRRDGGHRRARAPRYGHPLAAHARGVSGRRIAARARPRVAPGAGAAGAAPHPGMTRLHVSLRVPVGRPLPALADFVTRCEAAGFDGVGIHD